MKKLIVGFSGASGVIYGIRLLEVLRGVADVETHVIISHAAKQTIVLETDYTVAQVEALADRLYGFKDIAAAISSGSYRTMGMVIIPCAIKTLSGIEEPFRGSIILKTTSQKKPQITIAVMASVKKEIRVAPEYLYFGIINKDKDLDEKTLQRTTVISQMRTDDLKIKTIETSQDWIKTAVDTNQEGKQYTITISLDKDKLPQGKFREIVSIHTQSEDKPEVSRIIVEGKVL